MKIGDMVIRKNRVIDYISGFGPGIILSKQMGGSNPVHPCITVYYPSVGKIWDIAESLVEVISESR